MRRRTNYLSALVLAVAVAMTGCVALPVPHQSASIATPGATISPAATPSPSPIVIDPAVAAVYDYVDPLIDQALSALAAAPRDDLPHADIAFEYARSSLTPADQTLYDTIVAKEQAVEPYRYPAPQDFAVIQALTKDYPELDSYSAPLDVADGNQELFYFRPSARDDATTDYAQVRADILPMWAAAERIVQRMPAEASTYDKYRYLAYVETLVVTYDFAVLNPADGADLRTSNTAYGALALHRAVCVGYTEAYYYLCRLAGLWCAQVSGGPGHLWNLVKLDTGTYYVDVTWSDGEQPTGEHSALGSPEWLAYFMFDQATAAQNDHLTSMESDYATGTQQF